MKRILLLFIATFLLYGNAVNAEEAKPIQEEIIYDILIDRFNNGDPTLNKEQVDIEDPYTYNGGDIQGIITKLDHIETFGFTTITLSSLMENAPKGYHGYWIEDFFKVEEQFGSMEELNKLIEEAHQRNIKVVIELVTNYVSQTHPIAEDPDKQDWFKDHTVEAEGAHEWLSETKVLDQDHEEVQQYLTEVVDFWMDETDIDGFKFHAADQSSEQFLESITTHIKDKNPNFYLLANTLENDKQVDFSDDVLFDLVENNLVFEQLNEVFSEVNRPVSDIYEAWEAADQPNSLLFIDNKDTARFSNNVADHGRNTLTAWQMALTYMFTSQGVPIIYQGSELPMYGPGFPESQMLVQFNTTDPDLEEFYSRITAIRGEFPVFSHGDFEQVGVSEGLSVFKRTYQGKTAYVAINNSEESQSITLTDMDENMQLRGLIGDNTVRENENGEFVIGIPRESSEVYIMQENTGFNWWLIGFVVGVFLLFIVAIIILSRKQKQRKE